MVISNGFGTLGANDQVGSAGKAVEAVCRIGVYLVFVAVVAKGWLFGAFAAQVAPVFHF